MARGLNYLHTLKDHPLVHGDIKSANVLLDSQYEAKLGDFGLARQVLESSTQGDYTHMTVTSVHGTSVYLPPEYLRHKILSPAVDVYSYGIVMLEMGTGRRAYDGKKLLIEIVEDALDAAEDESHEVLRKLSDHRLGSHHLGMGIDHSCFDFLMKLGRDCAKMTKNKRPGMKQVLDLFEHLRAKDRIRRLSTEAGVGMDVIKSPLELQLWYDMVRKEGLRPPASTVCPTVGSSVHCPTSSTRDEEEEEDVKNEVEVVIPLLTELGFNNNSGDSVISVNSSNTEDL